MTRYQVETAAIAEKRVLEQVLHIAADSIDHAFAWEARLRTAIDHLDQMPTAHRVDGEASHRGGTELRKMVFEKNYLVFYRVDDAARKVIVVAFRHVARQPGPNEP